MARAAPLGRPPPVNSGSQAGRHRRVGAFFRSRSSRSVRKALNDNPVVAVGVIGLLGLVVALMLLHAISSRSTGGSSASTTASTTPTATPATTTDPASSPTTEATASAASVAAPSTAAVGAFEASPGLPKAVVDAYDSGKVVAI